MKKLLFFILFFSYLVVNSNPIIDSLLAASIRQAPEEKAQIYKRISKAYFEAGNLDSALVFIERASQLAFEYNSKIEQAEILFLHGERLFDGGELDVAMQLYTQSIALGIDDKKLKARVLLSRGVVYSFLGYYELSIQDLNSSLNLLSSLKDNHLLLNNALVSIGITYDFAENDSLALEFYQKALENFTANKDTSNISSMHNNIGTILVDNKEYRKAIDHFEKILDLMPQLDSTVVRRAVLSNLIESYNHEQDFLKSKKAIDQLKSINLDNCNSYNWFNCKLAIDEAYYLHKTQAGRRTILKKLEEVLELVTKLNSPQEKQKVYTKVSDIYAELYHSREALMYYKKATEINNSILNLKNKNRISELGTIYKTREQEKQYQLLKKDNELTIKENKNLTLLIIISILVTIIILLGFLYRIHYTKQKRALLKKEIDMKNQKLASITGFLVHKNEQLSKLKEKLSALEVTEGSEDLNPIIREVGKNIQLDEDWKQFIQHFEEVHSNFFKKLEEQHSNLTLKEVKHCALIKMNLSTNEIATLMNITINGVQKSRLRIRAKMKLETETDIYKYVSKF